MKDYESNDLLPASQAQIDTVTLSIAPGIKYEGDSNTKGGKTCTHAPGFLKIVNDAKSRIKELNVSDVQAKLQRGEKFHFVDVSEDDVATGTCQRSHAYR